ncbi:metallophosphoesterase [Bradyrhizobium sp. SYSU BS000235]|uniref:metallophosphoesterase n=1 Tax=Bradyrhizobium sp. SYSU BS000235 TaxID=3411332 RepID=UPI003C711759
MRDASTIYAIGDVHGRSDLLDRIVAFVQQDALNRECRPLVFFLGDIVDKGPDSCGAMKIVCDTIQRWPGSRLILGNHDYMFRDALTVQRHDILKWLLRNGGQETLASYSRTPEYDPSEILISIRDDFPEHVRVLHEASLIETFGPYGFVHAGIDPAVPIPEQQLPDCIQIRSRFLDHVGILSHVIVHGHTPVTPPRPVITENRISLDTHAWDTDILSMATFDIARETIEFFSTDEYGSVVQVEPVCIDRGLGTAWTQMR